MYIKCSEHCCVDMCKNGICFSPAARFIVHEVHVEEIFSTFC